jgi:putative (di)nucleoside polyphosphate hydrolase
MADVIDRDGFRANVGIVLMQDGGRVFVGRRLGGRGWQFPQGGMLRGESAEEALYRELTEEIGLTGDDVEIVAQTSRWLHYRLPERFVRKTRPECVGQKQRWFLLRLQSAAAPFRFDLTAEPEFDRWRWVDYWQPIREVIYFKRTVYTRALHELGRVAFPQGLPPYPAWWHPPGGSTDADPAADAGADVLSERGAAGPA